MQDFRPICQIRWVRIPPPPNKNGLSFSQTRFYFVWCNEVSILRRADCAIISGNRLLPSVRGAGNL